MLFSTPIFFFRFLPLVLAAYFVLRSTRWRNAWLLAVSLIFYAWGEPVMSIVMLVSITANYLFGLAVDGAGRRGGGRGAVIGAIAFNVGLLLFFKYADWLWALASDGLLALGAIDAPLRTIGSYFDAKWRAILLDDSGSIRLPIGISFFTFQALSYVLDVHRRDARLQRNPFDLALYVALFPQLIAGPIVRYQDVADQIDCRSIDRARFASGLRRFAIGLGKKCLIANVAAEVADPIFAIPSGELTPAVAWLGIVCYALQIYFDFSGYSDMAIGLGRMFGFHFLENFDFPYVARSITEFWRRWHISLSSWFRDYLYIPLGGNRKGRARTYVNLVTVFVLCGLWHGASASFLVWGLYHGIFLVIERVGLGAWLERRAALLRHAYLVLVVLVGWVFFRAADLEHAFDYLAAMGGASAGDALRHHVALYAHPMHALAIAAGVVGSMPWLHALQRRVAAWVERGELARGFAWRAAGDLCTVAVLVLALLVLSAGAYSPFIYFRF